MKMDLSSYVPALGWAAPTWPAVAFVTLLLTALTVYLVRFRPLSERRVLLVSLLSFLAPLSLFLVVNLLPRTAEPDARWVTVTPSAFILPFLAPLATAIALRLIRGRAAPGIPLLRRVLAFLGACPVLAATSLFLGPTALFISQAPGLLLLAPVFPSGHHHYANSLPHFFPLIVMCASSAWVWSLLALEVHFLCKRPRPA